MCMFVFDCTFMSFVMEITGVYLTSLLFSCIYNVHVKVNMHEQCFFFNISLYNKH